MAEDFDNQRRIFDGGDDLQGAAAIRAVLHVDVEDPFEQPGPAHARGVSLGRGVIGRGRGGTLCRSGNDLTAQLRVGRQHAVGDRRNLPHDSRKETIKGLELQSIAASGESTEEEAIPDSFNLRSTPETTKSEKI